MSYLDYGYDELLLVNTLKLNINNGINSTNVDQFIDSGTITTTELSDEAEASLATVTIGSEVSDTTCFPLFVTDATGDLSLKTAPYFTYNSNTGLLASVKFSGLHVPRIILYTDRASSAIEITITDQYELTAISNDTTFTITGTPVDGQKLMIRLKDAGVSKTLTWNSVFRVVGVTLPTATTAGKTHYIGCVYNFADSKWDVLAIGEEA
jgi:hypothetical protein